MLHDGLHYNDEYYFTSIDGKIIIASEAKQSKFNPREEIESINNDDINNNNQNVPKGEVTKIAGEPLNDEDLV